MSHRSKTFLLGAVIFFISMFFSYIVSSTMIVNFHLAYREALERSLQVPVEPKRLILLVQLSPFLLSALGVWLRSESLLYVVLNFGLNMLVGLCVILLVLFLAVH